MICIFNISHVIVIDKHVNALGNSTKEIKKKGGVYIRAWVIHIVIIMIKKKLLLSGR
jgi:hypothetical protein